MNKELLNIINQVKAIARTGLEYCENKYDIDRYQSLEKLCFEFMSQVSDKDEESLRYFFEDDKGYQTPKIDVRGCVFRGDMILLVQEKADGKWSIPGGYADVGLSASEIAQKEVWEESGLQVQVQRLMAVLDKAKHGHPKDPFSTYKMFFLCKETGGMLSAGMETSDIGFFSIDNLPPLSTPRVTQEQIALMYDLKDKPGEVKYD